MAIQLKILGSAAEKVGARNLEIKQDEAKPIREILPGDPLNQDLYIVLVDGKSMSLDSPVSGDKKVVIMPRISGG